MTMTADTLTALTVKGTAPSVATSRHDTNTARNVLLAAIGIQVAMLMPSLFAYGIDERTINDISVWTKPIKFQTSLILMLGTLVWLLPLISPLVRAGRSVRWWSLAAAFAATGEIVYITLQAARGRASHFNQASQLEGIMYSIMGVGAVILVVSAFAIGWMIWRHGDKTSGQGFRLGAALGLMIGAVLTLITAGYLGSANSHWVGGIASDANGLFLLGWSRTGGDLRVPHFFATHIMQALPLLGLMLDRMAPRLVLTGIASGSVLAVLVVAATFVQALMGHAFL